MKKGKGRGGRSAKRLRTQLKIQNLPMVDVLLKINRDAVDANRARVTWYAIHSCQ